MGTSMKRYICESHRASIMHTEIRYVVYVNLYMGFGKHP